MNAAIPHVTPGAPPGPPDAPAADESVYAGFWIRFAAWLIDAVIIIPVCFPAVWIVVRVIMGPDAFSLLFADEEPDPAENSAAAFATFAAIWAAVLTTTAYGVLFTASRMQATPGKFFLGMKVTDAAGNRLSIWRALGRDLAKFATGKDFLFLTYCIAGRTARKRALHDMAAGTYVVARRAGALAPPETRFVVNAVFAKAFDVFWPNFWRFCAVIGLGFIVPVGLTAVLTLPGIATGFGSGSSMFFGILVLILSFFVFSAFAASGLMWGAHTAINGGAADIRAMLARSAQRFSHVLTVNAVIFAAGVAAVAVVALAAAIPILVITVVFSAFSGGNEPSPVVFLFIGLLISIPVFAVLFAVQVVFAAGPAAAAIEDSGPFDSLDRSQHLTKGIRWKTLGVIVIAFMLIFGVPGFISDMLWGLFIDTFMPQADGIGAVLMNISGGWPKPLIIFTAVDLAVMSSLSGVFLYTVYAALYHELRAAKGEDPSAPAASAPVSAAPPVMPPEPGPKPGPKPGPELGPQA
ncbi:MAG: RDD family protein [Rhodospirillales bacterium]